jgi:hypothetical protein
MACATMRMPPLDFCRPFRQLDPRRGIVAVAAAIWAGREIAASGLENRKIGLDTPGHHGLHSLADWHQRCVHGPSNEPESWAPSARTGRSSWTRGREFLGIRPPSPQTRRSPRRKSPRPSGRSLGGMVRAGSWITQRTRSFSEGAASRPRPPLFVYRPLTNPNFTCTVARMLFLVNADLLLWKNEVAFDRPID